VTLPPRFSLRDRVAVVTGALGRLGPLWCSALLDAGAAVAAIDLDAAQSSDAFLVLQQRAPERVRFLRADVTARSALLDALSACKAELGDPQILVNNAGIDQPPGSGRTVRLEDLDVGDMCPVFDVNVLGTLLATTIFGAAMIRAGRGVIVNIGSIYASVSPDPRFYDHIPLDPPFLKPPAYGASKAAVVNLTRYFAAHWAPHGVRVNCLSPGGVADHQDPRFVRKYSARVPLGRLATDADLTGPLLFLASDASSYVTGVDLKVDGGFVAW